MITIDKLLEKYRLLNQSEHDKGSKFEQLMKNFLITYPKWHGKFSNVWIWNEFPFHKELPDKKDLEDVFTKKSDIMRV